MDHAEFVLGEIFWCGGRIWRCTDIGTRTVIGIRIDGVDVDGTAPALRRGSTGDEAHAQGWFNGPPYAVAEVVFDEDDMEACTLETGPDDVGTSVFEAEGDDGEYAGLIAAGIAQATALREQARAGGLRFDAYLPPGLADWLIDMIERGIFMDPSEAVFVMLGEQRDLAPHADLRDEILRRSLKAAMNDPRPSIPHEVVVEEMRQWMAEPRPEPAVWSRSR